jgi:methylamine--corrinoid protein Co-methyltransferase
VIDKTTGMEARVMGEAAMATAGMKISKVNEILENLISSYEKSYNKAPSGKRFQECYDVKTVKPTDEYLKVYDGAKATLRNFGLNMK